jgi:N utilization substance protein A
MAIALGEGDVKSLEDLAGLIGDDLRGYFEAKNGERVRVPGLLETFGLTSEVADQIIMKARVAAGWIDAPEGEEEAVVEAEAGDDLAEAYAEEAQEVEDPEALAALHAAEEEDPR